jgi:hypothetical protein
LVAIAASIVVLAPAHIGLSEATDGIPSMAVPDAAGLHGGHGGEGAEGASSINAVRPRSAGARSRTACSSAPMHADAGQRMYSFDRPEVARLALEPHRPSAAATKHGDGLLSVASICAWRGNEAGVIDGLKLQF